MALRDDVVKILAAQMGPAAAQFLERQCTAHLKKDAAAITKGDLPELAKWVGVGAGLTLGDTVGAALSEQILAIG
jgi:hypothetical protein